MYPKNLLWLLCATILTSQPAFAQQNNVGKATAPIAITKGISLDSVIEDALRNSPHLKAFNSSVAAAKGEQAQSGLWKNPELGIEAENIAGGGNYKGFDSAEVTYGVSQELSLGGKLDARKSIADKGLELAELDYQSTALNVIADVTKAYIDVIAADENVRLATEQRDLADDVLKSVSVRVGAAAAPLIQKSRAEVESYTATIAKDKAIRERNIAINKLAKLMGKEKLKTQFDSAALYATDKPDFNDLEGRLSSNPDIIKLNAALEQSQGFLDLEKANAIPDPRLNVGVRDFQDTGDQAFVVGVSIPIPVFDANSGNIEKATHEVIKTEFDNRQFMLNANTELSDLQQRIESAYTQIQTIQNDILPSANKAFGLAREGYGLGRFPYLDVLDAQRSLFAVKQQHIEALKEFHTAKAEIERLTAAHLSKIENHGEENEK
jgi:cobalt-zinc-cadmium efflux system outer membrane protein